MLFLLPMLNSKGKRLKGLVKILPFIIGFLAGFYFITLNVTGKDLSLYPGDLIDARFNNYILEHDYRFFTGKDPSLWDAPFMFPAKNVITYSDNLVGSAPFYSLFRVIGKDRETSFQLWYFAITFLNYACCYWFLLALFRNRYAAVLGAIVFTFSIALQSQVGHAQTFPRFPVALAFLAFLVFMKEFNPRYFFLLILAVVYEFYCGMYLGFMLTVPVGVFLLLGFLYKWKLFFTKLKSLKWDSIILASIVINGLLLLPLLIPYMERAKGMATNTFEEDFHSLLTIPSFFFCKGHSLCWKPLEFIRIDYINYWDHQVFAGGIATICLAVFALLLIIKLYRPKLKLPGEDIRIIAIIGVSAFLTFLLFLRFQSHSLYRYVRDLPGFQSMRALQRIINVELLFFAIATAFVFCWLFQRFQKLAPFFFLVAIGLIIADNSVLKDSPYSTSKAESQIRINSVIEKMKSIPAGSLVSYETTKDGEDMGGANQVDAMLASQSLNLKCVNGYSGYSPPGYDHFWHAMNEAGRKEWFDKQNFHPDKLYIVPK
jgi:hypothetical protein